MQLTLNETEVTLLQEVLEENLAMLRLGISRADHREYREMLRRRVDRLEDIQARMGAGEQRRAG